MNRGTKRRGGKTAEETPIKVLKPTAAVVNVTSPPPLATPVKEVPTKVVTPKQKAIAKVKPSKKGK